MYKRMINIKFLLLLVMILSGLFCSSSEIKNNPNVLWIVIEDASCHISCYGGKAIQTPNIDALAAEGVRFENAFVTAPVCSPSRSALVTGMYQNTIDAHNHRSQRSKGKGTNLAYVESFILPAEIPLASKLFEDEGYFVTNENINGKSGKEDYNFDNKIIYSGKSWKDCPKGKPFFTQIQLKGGKNRKTRANTEDFKLPPYYFEDSIMRNDWKEYLGSWLDTDENVKQIVADLKAAGVYENTLIFLLTDHGISHLRGKQFLYDEGIKVPLIVKFPNDRFKGTVRNDMVKHIDLLPSSLAFAGLQIPENIQGKNIFAKNYQKQEYIFSSRDRCDETTDIIRAVRTEKLKYIRNFLSYRPHAQRNQYKDQKEISKHTRELFALNKLNKLQAQFYNPTRPTEELYDLEKDPFEIHNLAFDPAYQAELKKLRSVLYNWMTQINDPGLIPEPYLEELGEKYGNKFIAMKQPQFKDINPRLIRIIEAGEKQNTPVLLGASISEEPAERYWAATWLGVNKITSAKRQLEALIKDTEPSVRIAANLALFKVEPDFNPIPTLSRELKNKNKIVGMYAMSAIDQTGILNDEARKIASEASQDSYEFTMRYGKYLLNK
ncbi:sulfatase-like hydrolase/transferase [Maribellus comscasis]|uniref:Sulfatase-like hydrolase/transferase n=1 Tax=Maribellus comscasis TaxID=2681766 RepID=A0A6I6JV30_9BACT|nr:sulfatase-like hydrolase/transferase [Maribellus comscasis]